MSLYRIMTYSVKSAKSFEIQMKTETAYELFFNVANIEYFKLNNEEIASANLSIKNRLIDRIKTWLGNNKVKPLFFDFNISNDKRGIKKNIIDIELFYDAKDKTKEIPLIKINYNPITSSAATNNYVYPLDVFLQLICIKNVINGNQNQLVIALLNVPHKDVLSNNFKSAKLIQNTTDGYKIYTFEYFIKGLEQNSDNSDIITTVTRRTPFNLLPMDVQVKATIKSDKNIKLITDIHAIFKATNSASSFEDKIKIIDQQIGIIKNLPLDVLKSPTYTDTDLQYIKNEVIKKINEEEKILMPPPIKRQKQLLFSKKGGTKKIIRKVFTDSKGKSYIKFNDFFIYLK